MRKLIYTINLSLDGCCEHTKFRPSEDLMEYYTALVRGAGAFVYGRKTYELMVPYWPDEARDTKDAYAHAFVAVPEIVVFSRTLKAPAAGSAPGQRTRIFGSDLKEEILRLKQEDGKDMLVGGVDLASQLVGLGLVDEFRIVIIPILAGEGRRLFADVPLQENLSLVESKTVPSGCVILRYAKK